MNWRRLTAGTCGRRNGFGLAIFPRHAHAGRAPAASPIELPDDHDDVIAMRIAPRTMLISTAFYVGGDVDIDERYREFRDLTMQTGDLTSLAIATAGRIWSFARQRQPRSRGRGAGIGSRRNGQPASTAMRRPRASSSIAVVYARFANCDFDAALTGHRRDTGTTSRGTGGRARHRPTQCVACIEICLGDYEQGRRHLRDGNRASACAATRHAMR